MGRSQIMRMGAKAVPEGLELLTICEIPASLLEFNELFLYISYRVHIDRHYLDAPVSRSCLATSCGTIYGAIESDCFPGMYECPSPHLPCTQTTRQVPFRRFILDSIVINSRDLLSIVERRVSTCQVFGVSSYLGSPRMASARSRLQALVVPLLRNHSRVLFPLSSFLFPLSSFLFPQCHYAPSEWPLNNISL